MEELPESERRELEIRLVRRKKCPLCDGSRLDRPGRSFRLAEAGIGDLAAMPLADLVKISEEELVFLTGENDLEKGAQFLIDQYGLKLVLITLGPGGAYAHNRIGSGRRPTYQVKVVDTTGAGDAFTGGFLYQLLKSGKAPDDLTPAELDEFLDFANAVGSIATTKKGAIPALPDLPAIEALRATKAFEGQ